jgi:uncharacterized membrane protein
MGFYDAFFGSDQSQYTAYAIVAAIIAICITILLTATDISISNRLLIVFFVIISLIPSVFLTLFELTCIVTGGTEPNKWWCYAFAWILAVFIIIYCIFIVIISLISLFTYNNAINNLNETENKDKLSPEVSNDYAKKIIDTDEKREKHVEKFYDNMEDELRAIQQQQQNNNSQPAFDPASMMPSIANQIMPGSNEGFDVEPTASPIEELTSDVRPNRGKIVLGQSKDANFTNYASVNSNEEFEDSPYFSYDQFKNTN